MTLAQTAEKPITAATEEAISNFADSRQRRFAMSLRRPKNIVRSRFVPDAPGLVAAALNGDIDARMR